jgi:hypothetical protein
MPRRRRPRRGPARSRAAVPPGDGAATRRSPRPRTGTAPPCHAGRQVGVAGVLAHLPHPGSPSACRPLIVPQWCRRRRSRRGCRAESERSSREASPESRQRCSAGRRTGCPVRSAFAWRIRRYGTARRPSRSATADALADVTLLFLLIRWRPCRAFTGCGTEVPHRAGGSAPRLVRRRAGRQGSASGRSPRRGARRSLTAGRDWFRWRDLLRR